MSGRASDAKGFRVGPAVDVPDRPGRRQSVGLAAVLLLVTAGLVTASFAVRPDQARVFDLLRGSVYLGYGGQAVGVDLATARPTLRLSDAYKQVGRAQDDLAVVPAATSTVLLNTSTGEFNMTDQTGFVVKNRGGGVALPPRTDKITAAAYPTRDPSVPGQAYIVRSGPAGTDVYLVDESVVQNSTALHAAAARASRQLQPGAQVAARGAAVSSGDDLWLLTDTDAGRRVQRLSLRPGSGPNATLADQPFGRADAVSAIGATTVGSGHSATAAVAVASGTQIRIFSGASAVEHRVPVSGLTGVTSVVPVSETSDRLMFLERDPSGWSLVTVRPDGTGLRGPIALGVGAGKSGGAGVTRIPTSANLVEPAYSDGALYTADASSGAIYRIALDGAVSSVSGGATVPIAKANNVPKKFKPGAFPVETPDFTDVQVIGDGSRVFINSSSHRTAVGIIAGDHPHAVQIRKLQAVVVSAAGGAEALAEQNSALTTRKKGARATQPRTTPKQQQQQQQQQQANNAATCANDRQKPNKPGIVNAIPGARTAQLTWFYPVVRGQDCVPSTFVITVKYLRGPGPTGPFEPLTVHNTLSTLVSGLYPQTYYSVSVAAYLHGASTASDPADVKTNSEGPSAPTGVTVLADRAGNWDVSWTSCGHAAGGCILAQSWTVTAATCDGRGGLVNLPPATVTASGSNGAITYPGSDGLLGRGLRFVVTGSNSSGEAGTPSAQTPCVYSTSTPVAGALTLKASKPPVSTFGSSVPSTVTLDLGDDPVRNIGGIGATATFTLTGGGTTQHRGPLVLDGRRPTVAADFTGLTAGNTYTASATVTAAHGGGTVTIGPVVVTVRSNWPQLGLTGSCPQDPSNLLLCNLSVQVTGISSAQANGETFDFDGQLACGNAVAKLHANGIDPSATPITVQGLSQTNGFHDQCALQGVTLREAGAGDYFGGVTATLPDTSVKLPDLASTGAGASAFDVAWSTDSSGNSVAKVSYNRSDGNLLMLTTRNWREVLSDPNNETCGSATAVPTPTDVVITADATCVANYGNKTGWYITIGWDDLVEGHQGDYTLPLAKTPPSYQPCAPTAFTAAWGNTIADGVTLTYTGSDPSDIAGCSNWNYALLDDTDTTCTPQGPGTAPPTTILVTCGTPPAVGWHVIVTYTDPAGNQQTFTPVPVDGIPPTS